MTTPSTPTPKTPSTRSQAWVAPGEAAYGSSYKEVRDIVSEHKLHTIAKVATARTWGMPRGQ